MLTLILSAFAAKTYVRRLYLCILWVKNENLAMSPLYRSSLGGVILMVLPSSRGV